MSSILTNLQHAFDFLQDDLIANRNGQLSERQQTRLKKRERRAGYVVWLFALGMAIVPAAGLFIFARQQNWPMAGLAVFLLVGLPLLGYRIASEEHRKWRNDLALGVADSVYGEVQLMPGRRAPRNAYRLVIENTAFAISASQAEALEAGIMVMVYYAPRSSTILSVEPVEHH